MTDLRKVRIFVKSQMSSSKDHLHIFEGSESSENKVKREPNISMGHVPSFASLVQPLSGKSTMSFL